jgi:hypothetical protein
MIKPRILSRAEERSVPMVIGLRTNKVENSSGYFPGTSIDSVLQLNNVTE